MSTDKKRGPLSRPSRFSPKARTSNLVPASAAKDGQARERGAQKCQRARLRKVRAAARRAAARRTAARRAAARRNVLRVQTSDLRTVLGCREYDLKVWARFRDVQILRKIDRIYEVERRAKRDVRRDVEADPA